MQVTEMAFRDGFESNSQAWKRWTTGCSKLRLSLPPMTPRRRKTVGVSRGFRRKNANHRRRISGVGWMRGRYVRVQETGYTTATLGHDFREAQVMRSAASMS